jgi:2-amino-4-hydroxy-6-hydroxymethyldihydropteridine diphosphokinase
MDAHTVYLSLGSNIGDRNLNIQQAIALIAERTGILSAISSVYETAPWGFESPHSFLNVVVRVETAYLPWNLLEIIQQIERDMGRTSKTASGYQDRIIDIDIIFYDDWVYQSEKLTLPHPRYRERSFVLDPLKEIVPDDFLFL